VIGNHLVRQLRQRGHEVTGTCRSPGKAPRLRALGAEPVALDALDVGAVREAVAAARPDAVIYQATALAGVSDFKHGPAVCNIVDDEPAPSRVWLPELAKIVGAKPPQHFPRLFAGEAPVIMATESRGASNAKARQELGWTPRYPSWRQGFITAYAQPGSVKTAA
jgi:nucleoside-diphosphate-sugar epimerase